jgi:DNA topoisomerase III
MVLAMRLWLAEKPSQARDIARVLGAQSKHDGYLEGASEIVTWCFGHLLEQAPPEHYGDQYRRWSLESLPIVPQTWQSTVKGSARKQFAVIRRLLEQAREVVIATDADREGEMIAREVLDACAWHGPVQRLWLSALDETSVRRALSNLWPGSKTEPLYRAATSRARADWLVGMNLTRAYTVLGRAAGHDGVLSVGRVQTPTLRLVVDRDRAIAAFVPQPYWDVRVVLEHANGRFQARWVPPAPVADNEGRCVSEASARQVAQRVSGGAARVSGVETTRVRQAPPLPLDLGTLQQEASRRWGMGAQATLQAAQSLYETHKATTYPRTDCPYLPQSMRADVPQVLDALAQSDPDLMPWVQRADAGAQSRAWNDAKITAHHAIIPTSAPCQIARMSESERRVYDLVRRRYLAQFYPPHEFDKTEVQLRAGEGDQLRATGKRIVVPGWRELFGADDEDADAQALPALAEGDRCQVVGAEVEAKKTTPPAHYTDGTLIAAMKNVSRLVEDPRLRKRLKETAGIGTEATRAGIIETLLERGFVRKRKKHVVATDTGRALVDALPAPVTDPGTTALWEQALEEIAEGRHDPAEFLKQQADWVRVLVTRAQGGAGLALRPADVPQHPCPACGKPMRRRKGRDGHFWGCTGYPECRQTLPDQRGKPGKVRTLRQRGLGG